jgi:hypothetical protein
MSTNDIPEMLPFEEVQALFNGSLQKIPDIPEEAGVLRPMVDLLLQKHRKDSNLSFKAVNSRARYIGGNIQQHVYSVQVRDSGDCIAVVSVKHSYTSDDMIYGVTSSKARDDKPRKGGVETTKFKRAVALLDKYAQPIDNVVRYERERYDLGRLRGTWGRTLENVRFTQGGWLSAMIPTADIFKQLCEHMGFECTQEMLDTFAERELMESIDNDTNFYVHIHNGVCDVLGTNPDSGRDEIVRSYPAHELPPELAMKIGMLKVASPKIPIKGVGAKESDNTFLIVGDYDAR